MRAIGQRHTAAFIYTIHGDIDGNHTQMWILIPLMR